MSDEKLDIGVQYMIHNQHDKLIVSDDRDGLGLVSVRRESSRDLEHELIMTRKEAEMLAKFLSRYLHETNLIELGAY